MENLFLAFHLILKTNSIDSTIPSIIILLMKNKKFKINLLR